MAVSDNFNRADGGLGANWTNSMSSTAPQISTNRIVGGDGAYGAAHWSANTFSDAHDSQYDELGLGSYSGPGVRHATGGNWYAYFNNGDVQKCVGGSATSIGTRTGFAVQTAKLAINGTTLTPSINGTPGSTITDASLSGGAAGMVFYSTSGFGDNWVGTGEIVAGGGGPLMGGGELTRSALIRGGRIAA